MWALTKTKVKEIAKFQHSFEHVVAKHMVCVRNNIESIQLIYHLKDALPAQWKMASGFIIATHSRRKKDKVCNNMFLNNNS